MKPLIYSVKEAEESRIGWQRDGFNIAYYQGARKKRNTPATSSNSNASTASSVPPANTNGYGPLYYALSFEIMFKCK